MTTNTINVKLAKHKTRILDNSLYFPRIIIVARKNYSTDSGDTQNALKRK